MQIQIAVKASSRDDLIFALKQLVRFNRYQLEHSDEIIPPLYRSRVRYQREIGEQWQTIKEVLANGYGDCEDLAAWRVAELQSAGERAQIRLTRRGRIWHVTVVRGDGRFEDPSRILGMTG